MHNFQELHQCNRDMDVVLVRHSRTAEKQYPTVETKLRSVHTRPQLKGNLSDERREYMMITGCRNGEDADGKFVRGGFGRVSSKRNGGGEKYNLIEECTVPSPTMQRSRRNKRQSRCRNQIGSICVGFHFACIVYYEKYPTKMKMFPIF